MVRVSVRVPTGVPKWRNGAGMILVSRVFQLSKNEDIGIFGGLSRAENLCLAFALAAETIDPETVFARVDQLLGPAAESLQRFRVQQALKDRILHPHSKVFQGVGQAGSPPIVDRS